MKIIFKDNTSQTEEFRVYCENCDSRVKVDILNKLTVSVFFLKRKQVISFLLFYQVYPELDEALLTRVMGTAKLTIMEENSFSGDFRERMTMILIIKIVIMMIS